MISDCARAMYVVIICYLLCIRYSKYDLLISYAFTYVYLMMTDTMQVAKCPFIPLITSCLVAATGRCTCSQHSLKPTAHKCGTYMFHLLL